MDCFTWGIQFAWSTDCSIYSHRLVSYLSLSVGAGQEATDLPFILFHPINVHPQLFTGCVSRAVDFRCIVGVINVLSKNVRSEMFYLNMHQIRTRDRKCEEELDLNVCVRIRKSVLSSKLPNFSLAHFFFFVKVQDGHIFDRCQK